MTDAMRQDMANPMTRGLDDSEPHVDEDISGVNFIFSFGCKPSSGVPARSTFAKDYFDHLKRMSNADGSVILPEALLYWQNIDKEAELT